MGLKHYENGDQHDCYDNSTLVGLASSSNELFLNTGYNGIILEIRQIKKVIFFEGMLIEEIT
jgi:hypothetical protein